MVIDISPLTKGKVTEQKIDLTLNSSDFFIGDTDIKITEPVVLNGGLTKLGDIIHLDIQITTTLLLICSRCTENFSEIINIDVHEIFSNNPTDEDGYIIFINSDVIDITEIVENNLFWALPIKKLCKEDCMGLCQKCGSNLNISTCNCENRDVDPRLAKLKDLFF